MSENKDWKTIPVYRQSGAYARLNGELDAYHESEAANHACRLAIEQIIRERFDGVRLPRGLAEKIIDQFGRERVTYLLANTVQKKDYDGRFGTDNKTWAAGIPILPDMGYGYDRNVHIMIETHPAVLDGFIRHARIALEAPSEPTLHEQLKQAMAARSSPGVPAKKQKRPSQKRSAPEH